MAQMVGSRTWSPAWGAPRAEGFGAATAGNGTMAATAEGLSRELHDGVLQDLVYVCLELSSLVAQAAEESPALGERLRFVEQVTRGSAERLREVLGVARRKAEPKGSLKDLLERSVQDFRAKTGVAVRLEAGRGVDGASLPGAMSQHVTCILGEALRNAWRHGHASTIKVTMRKLEQVIIVSVADDGAGFDPARVPDGHYGLQIMRERAQALGGDLNVTSRPGSGTTVSLFLTQRTFRA